MLARFAISAALVSASLASGTCQQQVQVRVRSKVVSSLTIGSQLFDVASSPEIVDDQEWTTFTNVLLSSDEDIVLHASNVSANDVQVVIHGEEPKQLETVLVEQQPCTYTDDSVDQLIFSSKCQPKTIFKVVSLPCSQTARLLLGSRPDRECPDPFVAKINAQLYYLFCTSGNVVRFYISSSLNFDQNRFATVVGTSPTTFLSIWAPEMHYVGNSYKIYFSADTSARPGKHRLYVAQHKGGSMEQASNWEVRRLTFASKTWRNSWAIDPTVFFYQNKPYILFSSFFPSLPPNPPNCCGAPDDSNFPLPTCRNPATGRQCFDDPNYKPQRIAIAELGPNGLKALRTPKVIAKPDNGRNRYWNEWNRVNEGPAVVFRGQTPVIIYSAGYFALDNYNLKQLDFVPVTPSKGVLGPENWTKKFVNRLALSTSTTNQVWAPGHCAFVRDESGNLVVVYHGRRQSVDSPGADQKRYVRAQPFTWGSDGFININNGAPLPVVFQ